MTVSCVRVKSDPTAYQIVYAAYVCERIVCVNGEIRKTGKELVFALPRNLN